MFEQKINLGPGTGTFADHTLEIGALIVASIVILALVVDSISYFLCE